MYDDIIEKVKKVENGFKQNPKVAISLLSKLKDDKSEYVRKSVGNSLKDISKKTWWIAKFRTSNMGLTTKADQLSI